MLSKFAYVTTKLTKKTLRSKRSACACWHFNAIGVTDLRVISTAMKMITDIERIGDLAVEIAKITMKIEKELGRADGIDIPRMAKVAQRMMREALEAYVKRDLELVKSICANDDEVDDLYRDLRGQLFDSMRSDPDNVVVDSWLLLAIHHVERIADHAVNIAERVSFMVTGRFEQLAPSHRSDLPMEGV